MFAKHSREAACSAMEALLEDYLEDRLAAESVREVEAHVHACARCAGALARAKGSIGLLRPLRARQMPEAGPLFAGRVMARIRQQRLDQELWKPLETVGRQLCWLAAAAAVILAVFTVRFQRTGAPPPISAATQQTQVQELINLPISQPAVQDDTLLVAFTNPHAR